MDRKIMAISLVMLATFAATIGAFALTTYGATTANANNVVADNAVTNDQSTATTATADATINTINQPPVDGFIMERGFGGFGGGPRGHGFGGMMGRIEVSSDYTAKVNAILGNDTDVANLIAQGYNTTRIMPQLRTVIDGNGAVTTQATTAIVLMQGTSGFATVHVDVANNKVTTIETVTRTVINK
jgi:hypothetical protein